MSGRLGMTGAGIGHGDKSFGEAIAKSYLGNGVWGKATEVGATKLTRAMGQHTKEARQAQRRVASDNRLWPQAPDIKLNRGQLKPTRRDGFPLHLRPIANGQGVAGVSYPNGRGGGDVFIHPELRDEYRDSTERHELAHIAPKRNPHTLNTRGRDPWRRGREEGRADFVAHGQLSPGEYPGDKEFQRGYNNSQRRMLAARLAAGKHTFPPKGIVRQGGAIPMGSKPAKASPVIRRPGDMANDVGKSDVAMYRSLTPEQRAQVRQSGAGRRKAAGYGLLAGAGGAGYGSYSGLRGAQADRKLERTRWAAALAEASGDAENYDRAKRAEKHYLEMVARLKRHTMGGIGGGIGVMAGSVALMRSGRHEQQKKIHELAKREDEVKVTMPEHRAHELARQYDVRGPLPKHLDRNQRMEAYEARYIASGGRKAEKWKRRANAAEVGRNAGLIGATGSAAALLAARSKRTGAVMARTRGLRHLTPRRMETAALSSALAGGWSELYGEYARHKRASYASSPAGVAASALTRMRNYTPGGPQ